MVSDTPETDAFIERLNDDWDVEFAALTSHAKKLERELREAREQCHKLRLERMAADRAYADICREMELKEASIDYARMNSAQAGAKPSKEGYLRKPNDQAVNVLV